MACMLIIITLLSLAVRVFASNVQNDDKIVIIGAGPAGIAAATKLSLEFENIVILEAENYIGGFINTVTRETPNGMDYVEHGEQWIIYGQLTNTVFNEMEDNTNGCLIVQSASFKSETNGASLIFSNGTTLAEHEAKAAHDLLLGFYGHKSFPAEHTPDKYQIVSSYVKELLQKGGTESVTLQGIQDVILRFYENFILSLGPIGDWNNLSYRSFSKMLKSGMMLNCVKCGMSSIFNLTFEQFHDDTPFESSQFNIQLNKTVATIDYSGVNTIIYTTDGDYFLADKVIVTIPLGALKHSYRSLFYPTLPGNKVSAIQQLNTSFQEKALLEFHEPWWPNNFSYYQLWTNEAYENLAGGREWLRTLLGFTVVDNNSKMLVAYFKGPDAQLLKDVNDDTLKRELLDVLRSSLVYKFTIPEPIRFYRTNWSGNANFGGGYSYKTNAAVLNNVSNSDFADSLDGKVYFAGEYAMSSNWGNLIADIESGLLVAGQFIESIEN